MKKAPLGVYAVLGALGLYVTLRPKPTWNDVIHGDNKAVKRRKPVKVAPKSYHEDGCS